MKQYKKFVAVLITVVCVCGGGGLLPLTVAGY